VLLLAPAVARAAPALAGRLFRAATPATGAGADFVAALPRAAGVVPLVLTVGLGGLLLGIALGLIGAALLAPRIGGVTGDVLGATVELSELGVLLAASAVARLGGF
jgi:adenosylcobinamide-GDP ribazoletransferase